MIFGWDASHYDAVPAGGGARVAAEGFSFFTHKAGGDSNDAEIGAWWSAVRSFRDRLLLGAYWVLYPGGPVGRADAFLARLDATCPGWRDGPFILQVDCEKWNGDASTQPGKGDIKAFCDRLVSKVPKLRPIVYASAGQYGNSLAGLGYPLWNARYPLSDTAGTATGLYARCGGDSGKGWAAYSGQTPAIWQFTSSATIAGQTTSDANAFRGTLAQLVQLVAPGWSDDVALDADLKAYLDAKFAAITAFDKPQSDGTPTSAIGRLALTQGIPNGTREGEPRDQAWQVLTDLGKALVALQAQVAAIEPASSVTIDYTALAQALAAAFPAQLADQVADVLAQRLSA